MTDLRALISEIEQSGLFDADWYADRYGDVPLTGLPPIEHFARYGIMMRRDPGPGFDTRFYLERYHDVAHSGVSAFLHYIRNGLDEGRLPLRPNRAELAEAPAMRPASAPAGAAWDYRVATDAFARRGLVPQAPVAVVAQIGDAAGWDTALDAARAIGRTHDLFLLGPPDPDCASLPDTTLSLTWAGEGDRAGEAAALAALAVSGCLAGYDAVLILRPGEGDAAALRSFAAMADAFRADADWGCAALHVGPRPLPLDPPVDDALIAIGMALPRTGFPAPRGPALWLRPLLARVWRAAPASLDWDQALDLIGAAAAQADMQVATDPPPRPAPVDRAFRAVAFYLPQFHPIPENDRWWGPGFTEWTNVTRGRALFDGHDQPRRPGALGYYDLRTHETQVAQAALARRYGIHGFCYHYYWFAGRKLLNGPIDHMLASPDIDLPFCVCWANENWSRNWDGLHLDVLLEQQYSLDSNVALIREFIPMMRDPRYIRHDGKPVLIVYRIAAIPDWRETARLWRDECRRAGIGEIHLCAVRFDLEPLEGQPGDHGLDAYVLFPPHEMARHDARVHARGLDPAFCGDLFSYDAVVDEDLARFADGTPWPVHRGAMLRWDNMARRGVNARIYHGASPFSFRRWMKGIARQDAVRPGAGGDSLMFINAWNEWAEGSYLEPDESWGDAGLEAVRSAIAAVPGLRAPRAAPPGLRAIGGPVGRDGTMTPAPRPRAGSRAANPAWPTILVCAHISGHQLFGGERSLIDVLEAFAQMPVNIVLTLPSDNHPAYVEQVRDLCVAWYAFPYPQWLDRRDAHAWLTLDFADILLRHGVDVVHANTIMLLEPLVAARALGRTSVVHARELVTLDPVLQQRMAAGAGEIVAAVQRRADWIIGNSAATCALYGQGGRALHVPNAVSIDAFDMPAAVARPVRFGIVSSNIAAKGIDDFVAVAARVADLTDRARFVIIGPRTDAIDAWMAQVEAGERPANLECAGYIDDPRAAMARLDVLLNLSTFGESFGRTVAEAMAARRPVIAYHWGALPELVDHGVTGWLLPFRDVDAVARQVAAIAQAPESIAPAGEAARARIAARYSQPHLAAALDAAYATILADRRPAAPAPMPAILILGQGVEAALLTSCLDALLRHLPADPVSILLHRAPGEAALALPEGVALRTDPLDTLMGELPGRDVLLLSGRACVRPRWLPGLRVAALAQGRAVAPVGRHLGRLVPDRDGDDAAALLLMQALAGIDPVPVASAPVGALYLPERQIPAALAALADGATAAADPITVLSRHFNDMACPVLLAPTAIVDLLATPDAGLSAPVAARGGQGALDHLRDRIVRAGREAMDRKAD